MPSLFPQNRYDRLRLGLVGSVTLVVAMIHKEWPLQVRSGGREAFHWSYDLLLFIAAVSSFTFAARIWRLNRVMAVLGFGCSIAGVVWIIARPTY